MIQVRDDFSSPGPEWRGKPFWSWNGKLDRDELIRQIHVFKAMGLGGFFMHSRTGLVTDYLGDEWFDLTNACADEAARLGMEAWLYDEDRWPSGTAGGLVTIDPRHRAKFISLTFHASTHDIEWDDATIAAFVCRRDGALNVTGVRRVARGEPIALAEGESILLFRTEQHSRSTFYNGFTYVDTMSRPATDAYLKLTHDRYAARCGDRLGASIKGIFTDEPHRGPVMNGFSLTNVNKQWMTPWTETLFDDYRVAFGQDLVDALPELFLCVDGRDVSPVKWRYMELTQRLFLENFLEPLHAWCERHKLLLTGHVLHEDSLTAQACMQGSMMRSYEHMHWPGIDVLGEHNRCWWVAKQLQSVARQLGQKWLLSELYGCTGWQMTFEQHKHVGDWQALFGINVRCHHLSWYTMAGEAKRDYPASISFQSAWWPHYRHVEDYFARFGQFLSVGRPVCDVLVINPVESLWAQVHGDWARGLSPTSDGIKRLDADYAELFHWIAGAHIDFDYGDEGMLGRLAAVRGDRVAVGEATYRTVVVGHATTLRGSTLRLLSDFADAGGRVIFVGDPPAFVDAVGSAAPRELAARATTADWSRDAAVAAIVKSGRPVRVTLADGTEATEVFAQLHDAGDGTHRLVLLNSNRANGFAGLAVEVTVASGEVAVAEWEFLTGARYAAARGPRWTLDLPAGGSRAFVIGTKACDGLAPRRAVSLGERRVLAGPFPYALAEPNVCVLDTATYAIDGGPMQQASEVLKIDRAIRKAFGKLPRAGDMVQPWYRKRSEPTPPKLGSVRLKFTFDVRDVPATPVAIAMETPERFAVTLNGVTIDTAARDGWWVDPAFQRVPLPTGVLRVGANELTLDADFDEDLNIEAIYLLGAFGVALNGARAILTRLPEMLSLGDLTTQGLPFYGAGVRYVLPVPAGTMMLDLNGMEAACAVIGDRIAAFQPLTIDLEGAVVDGAVSLDVVLTRRNTFGPLHQVPLRTGHYGPDNFVTTGERWTDAYNLYPSGLLSAPTVVVES